jgi:hypothetical protein
VSSYEPHGFVPQRRHLRNQSSPTSCCLVHGGVRSLYIPTSARRLCECTVDSDSSRSSPFPAYRLQVRTFVQGLLYPIEHGRLTEHNHNSCCNPNTALAQTNTYPGSENRAPESTGLLVSASIVPFLPVIMLHFLTHHPVQRSHEDSNAPTWIRPSPRNTRWEAGLIYISCHTSSLFPTSSA